MAEPIPVPFPKSFNTGDTRGRSATHNWWQAARDVRNIARNARITLPTGAELMAIKAFVSVIVRWDSGTSTYLGTRPWLGVKLNLKAISEATHYVGSTAVEPAEVWVKVLDHISRDLKKIPVNDTEATAVDTLIAATDNRFLGTQPFFGGVAGSVKTEDYVAP